jgi:hypothetical protein
MSGVLPALLTVLLDQIPDERIRGALAEATTEQLAKAWDDGYEAGFRQCRLAAVGAIEALDSREED